MHTMNIKIINEYKKYKDIFCRRIMNGNIKEVILSCKTVKYNISKKQIEKKQRKKTSKY